MLVSIWGQAIFCSRRHFSHVNFPVLLDHSLSSVC
jgi:hypothetical protein